MTASEVSQYVRHEGVSLRLEMDGMSLGLRVDYPGGTTVIPVAGAGAGTQMLDLIGRMVDVLDAYEATVAVMIAGELGDVDNLAAAIRQAGDVNHPVGGGVDEDAPCAARWVDAAGELWCMEHGRAKAVCDERGAF